MELSLSVRIAEGFLSKEIAALPLSRVAEIANAAGYQGVCMRASQIGVQSSASAVEAAREQLDKYGLRVSMVTGDFDTVYNNERGPLALQNIRPYIDLARQLGAPMIRVALKRHEDIAAAQVAADIAADANLQLVHQCHTLSLFETTAGIVQTLEAIDRANFGLIYEPANLELGEQDYGPETISRLAPWIRNVYLQNQIIHANGKIELDTWCRGRVRFDIIPIHQPGGIDFARVIAGLKAIQYAGTVTVHQSAPQGEDPQASAVATSDFLRRLMAT